MREILFKAKRVDNQEWVEGLLSKWKFRGTNLFVLCIQTIREWDSGDYLDFIEVDPETVCQFTGLLDKNGKKIFEGDIYYQGDTSITYTVIWKNLSYLGKQNGSSSYAGLEYWRDRIEIVGNIHDKKEDSNGKEETKNS